MNETYHYTDNEANFGPPIEDEVPGGAHLTFDAICTMGGRLVTFRRPDGLHGAKKNALYFPHGLIRFGETVGECVQRLANEQGGGSRVERTRLYTMPSWVEDRHWHMCLNVIAYIDDIPVNTSEGVSEIVLVERGHSGSDFGWWTDDQLEALFEFIDPR